MEKDKINPPSNFSGQNLSNINWTPFLIIIGLVLFGSALAWVNTFFSHPGPAQSVINNLNQQKLNASYIEQSQQIVNGYLSIFGDTMDLTVLSQERVNDLVGKTKQAQEKMLSLWVPTSAKDFHLKVILLLGDIEKNLSSKKFTVVNQDVAQLKDSLNKIN